MANSSGSLLAEYNATSTRLAEMFQKSAQLREIDDQNDKAMLQAITRELKTVERYVDLKKGW